MKLFPKRWLSLFLLGFFLFSSSASVKSPISMRIHPQTESTIESPIVARVYFSSQDELKLLVSWLDVWDVDHAEGYIVAMLRPSDYQILLQSGFRIEIDAQKTADLSRRTEPLPGQVSGFPGYPCFRTVEETYTSLHQLATDYPDLVSVTDIGDSWEKVDPGGLSGYDIYSIVITNQAIPGPKPKFFLMAAIHAREYATAELATRFAEHLIANYGIDPDITWLIDYFEIHIVPQTNPDGRKIAEGGELWRKNTDDDDGCIFPRDRGVDLNRNSSFKWGYDNSGSSPSACAETYRGPSAASEPETQAVQNYVSSIFPDQRGNDDSDPAPDDAMGTFISLHSFGEKVLFPWGWSEVPSPNGTPLETLGRKFGFFNQYLVCQTGVLGCIYSTNGSTDDWAYGDLGVAAYTFEIGTEFFESCSYFENTLIQENFPALLFAFKAARLPFQNPSGPETLNLALDSDSVPSGSAVILTATANDTRFDSNGWGAEPTQSISAARYSLDAPSWETGTTFPLDAADGSFNTSVEYLQATIDTTGLTSGRHLLFVESLDASGNWGAPSAIFLAVKPDFDFKIDPILAKGSGRAGEVVDYSLTITNTGALEDSYSYTLGEHSWETSLTLPVTPLPADEGAQTIISVVIPADSIPGAIDQVEITFTSQGDPTRFSLVTLVTKVANPFYLPIIQR